MKRLDGYSKLLLLTFFILYIISLGSVLYSNYLAGDNELWQMVVNGFLISIPLVLMYFSFAVLLMAARQKRKEGVINEKLRKLIYKTPRIAGIVIASFVLLFSFDVFEEGGDIFMMILGFIMHSLPSIFIGVVIFFSWKRPVVGFYFFLVVSLFFLYTSFFSPFNLLIFFFPIISISLLFWADWKWGKQQ